MADIGGSSSYLETELVHLLGVFRNDLILRCNFHPLVIAKIAEIGTLDHYLEIWSLNSLQT